MWPEVDDLQVVTSWTNGRKAVVHLVRDARGRQFIRKAYRPGWHSRMLRDCTMAAYVSRVSAVGPRVLGLRPWRREMLLEYLPGERVLEWVLARFGDNLDLAEFQSFHGLMPPDNVDSRVAEAFRRFRASTSEEAARLKRAIWVSYSTLHRIWVKHGSVDPRNVLYHDGRIFIIDYDNARPSLHPGAADNVDLQYWYGIAGGH